MELIEKVRNLPSTPGVYLMKDSQEKIIYVGKAKNLRNRVRTYFQNSKAQPRKIKKLQANIVDLNYILTDTEFEAFMLECKLIKEIKPHFNKLMKNPQTYIFVKLQIDGDRPSIDVTNFSQQDSSYYFGPFTSKKTVETAIQGIKDFFKINCCQSSYKNTPCLNYSLGLCIGICFDRHAVDQYKNILKKISSLLSGTDISLIEEINQRMVDAAASLDFETAAKCRNTLDAIHSLVNKERVIEFTNANQNIVIFERLDVNTVKFFLIKGKQILFQQKYNIENSNIEQLFKMIKINVISHFKLEHHPIFEVSSDDIDEAQIIYRYLKSSKSTYFVIPDHCLENVYNVQLDELLTKGLTTLLIPSCDHV